jgi:hypothetical protein
MIYVLYISEIKQDELEKLEKLVDFNQEKDKLYVKTYKGLK